MSERNVEIETRNFTGGTLGVEYDWEIPEGCRITAPADGPLPKLIVTITRLPDE